MEIVQVIVWFLLAIWGANVMEKKNRSWWAGAAWGGLLGLVGVIICYLHSKKELEEVEEKRY